MYHTNVVISFSVEGIHAWPDIPLELEEVGFLKFPHRHNFHIKAKKKVDHDNRDIEIILLQREIKNHLKKNYWSTDAQCLMFNAMSCEMIAKELVQVFGLEICEVLEDGENGAEVVRENIKWKEIIYLCGYPCSGKETFIKAHLPNHSVISVSSIVKELTQQKTTSDLNNTSHLAQEIAETIVCTIAGYQEEGKKVVVDGLRQYEILEKIIGGDNYEIVWLEVPSHIREMRYCQRKRETDDLSYDQLVDLNDVLGLANLEQKVKTLLKNKTRIIEN